VLRGVKYGLYAVVLTGLVGGTVAWVSVDKSVKISVDGQTKTVHTTSGDVRGALADAGISVGAHDLIAPGESAKVHNGSEIVLKRGRLLHLDIDGQARDLWVTAPTVADALSQLGYSTADFSSVSRSKRLPLSPTDIELRTVKSVSVIADKRTQVVQSTDSNVGQLLSDLQIKLGANDRVSVPVASAFSNGATIIVQRVTKGHVTQTTVLPFGVSTRPDATMTKGTTKVVQAGVPGSQQTTYAVIYIDGKLTGKTPISTKVVAAPQTKVVHAGTKPVPVAPPVTSTPSSSTPTNSAPIVVNPGSAQAIAQQLLLARGWGNDQMSCLINMWNRESGWRVNAANGSGAYGIPQALPGSKMAAFGADWQTNPKTQIEWGLSYISGRYGTPCGAWSSWQAQGWY
jgi:resuscitation-promoting factor RpfB